MAYNKNKRPRSKKFKSSFKDSNPTKKIVLGVIGVAVIAVIAFTIYGLIATPEFLTKRKIESITADYYENYFYNAILENNSIDLKDASDTSASSAISSILEEYTESGFTETSLRQVLLSNHGKHFDETAEIEKYCDLDQSEIEIFPESPFGRKNYRVEYTYSCKF